MVAAYRVLVSTDEQDTGPIVESLKQTVRDREHRCVATLLEMYRFRPDDYEADLVPLDNGQWGLDLFSAESLKQFGVRAGGGAVAGGIAGLAVDAMTGGLSLGAAAASAPPSADSMAHSKATAGASLTACALHRSARSGRHPSPVGAAPGTTGTALLTRGHASPDKIQIEAQAKEGEKTWTSKRLPQALLQAKTRPEWSRLGTDDPSKIGSDSRRRATESELAGVIEAELIRSLEV